MHLIQSFSLETSKMLTIITQIVLINVLYNDVFLTHNDVLKVVTEVKIRKKVNMRNMADAL